MDTQKTKKIGVRASGAEIQTSAVDTRTAVWVSTPEKFSKIILGKTRNSSRKFRGVSAPALYENPAVFSLSMVVARLAPCVLSSCTGWICAQAKPFHLLNTWRQLLFSRGGGVQHCLASLVYKLAAGNRSLAVCTFGACFVHVQWLRLSCHFAHRSRIVTRSLLVGG